MKTLLTLFVMVWVFSAFSQGYWQENYPWNESGYTEWATVADTYQVSIGNSAIISSGLKGLTDFTNPEMNNRWTLSWGQRYSLSENGDQLDVTFNPSITTDLWSAIFLDFAEWQGSAPSGLTTVMADHFMGGNIVDMQPSNTGFDNGTISGEILIPSKLSGLYPNPTGSFDAGFFVIKLAVYDVHGHELNAGGDVNDTIPASELGAWTHFSFDYNDLLLGYGNAENPGDGWSGGFNGMARSIPGNDESRAPIDFTKVGGVRIYLCPGKIYDTGTLDGTVVSIRNLVVGDESQAMKIGQNPIVADRYWDSLTYPEWDAVAWKYLASVDETAHVVSGLKGLTNFNNTDIRIGKSWRESWDTYRYSLSGEGNELLVDIDFSKEKFGAFETMFSSADPEITTFSLGTIKVNDFIVDMKNNEKIISFDVYVPSSLSTANAANTDNLFHISANPIDIHGHYLNSVIPYFDVTEFDTWVNVTMNWDDILANQPESYDDAWTGMFYGLERPFGVQVAIPIDWEHIAGIQFYAGNDYEMDLTGQIKIRNLIVGNSTNAVVYDIPEKELENSNYWDATCYPSWDTIAADWLVNYDVDSAIAVDGLNGLTDFYSHPENATAWGVESGSRYAISQNGTQVDVNFKPFLEYEKWSGIQSKFYFWPNGNSPQNPDVLSNYSIGGYIVDMSENRTVSGEVYIPSTALDTDYSGVFPITISVTDAHGHQLNTYPGADTIKIFDQWTSFTIDFNDQELFSEPCDGDSYSAVFHNLTRPIDISDRVPIDWEHISAVNLSFWFGHIYGSGTGGTVSLRNITVGNQNNAIPFVAGTVPAKSYFELLISSEIFNIDADGSVIYEHMYASDIADLEVSITSLTDGFNFTADLSAFTVTNTNVCDAEGQAEIHITSASKGINETIVVTVPNYNEMDEISIADIPNFETSGAVGFSAFDLKDYITYACSKTISATASGSDVLTVNFDNDLIGTVIIGDNSWMGSTDVTVEISLDGTLVASETITFIQNYPVNDSYTTPPSVAINPSKLVIDEGETISFNPSLKKAIEVEWQFEGANISSYYELYPEITFAEAGEYTVTLIGKNNSSQTTETVVIKVVGITGGKSETCLHETIELTANLDGAEYLWSTNETSQSITISPTEATDYSVTITKDGETYTDLLSVTFVQTPFKEELCLATVSEDNKSVILAWERTANKGIDTYKILREGNKTNQYDTIATVPFSDISIYVDKNAEVMRRSYKYAIVTEDVCGNRSEISRIHKSVHLQITKDIYGDASLQWSVYEPEDIYETIEIHRIDNGKDTLVEEIAGSQVSYTDDEYEEGNIYRVAIILKEDCDPSTLKSNSGPFSQSISNLSEAQLTATTDMSFSGDIIVYPNPNNGGFNYLIVSNEIITCKVQLATLTGTLIYRNSHVDVNKVLEHIENIDAGIYNLTVTTSGGSVTQQVIVK